MVLIVSYKFHQKSMYYVCTYFILKANLTFFNFPKMNHKIRLLKIVRNQIE